MAEQSNDNFDDLDAFFSAAASDDPHAMEKAAQNVATGGRTLPPTGSDSERSTAGGQRSAESAAYAIPQEGFSDLDGKFIAIDPESIPGASEKSNQPFVLIPAHIHSILPWWAWVTIGLGLSMLIAGVVVMPELSTSRLVSRLGDKNEAQAQAVMRQLVLQGDERTVNKLYDMASSNQAGLGTRLRAVDTLGLMRSQGADRALLRLELARGTDERVRDAAIAARRQREAAKTRTGMP